MYIGLSREKSIAICMHADSYNSKDKAVVVLAGQILTVQKTIESQNSLGWKGPLKVQHPAMSRDIFHSIRLLRAPSNLTMNVPSNGASATSLDNLFHCFTILIVKNFFLISSLNLPSPSLKPLPLVL